jgi:WD40 repeat protein
VLKAMLLGKLKIVGLFLAVVAILLLALPAALPHARPEVQQPAQPPARAQKADPAAVPADALFRLGTIRLRHPAKVYALAFSPNGQQLASADAQGRVCVWDAHDGKLRLELPANTGTTVTFSPDGNSLATGGSGTPVRLWAVASGKLLRTLEGITGAVLAFAPDGKRLLVGAGQQAVLYEIDTSRVVRRFEGLGREVQAVAFSRDGKTVAAGGGTGHVAVGLPGDGDCVIALWETVTGQVRRRIENVHHGWVYSLAISPDGTQIAAASPYAARVWSTSTGERLGELGHGASGAVAFDAAGKRLVAAGEVGVWDAATWQRLQNMKQGANFAGTLAVSPDGKTIASNGVYDGRIRLWDAETGRERFTGPGHRGDVRGVAFSPEGGLIATSSGGDHSVRLWDAKGGDLLRALTFDCGSGSHWCMEWEGSQVAFTPDSRTVATGSIRSLHLWDCETGREIAKLQGDSSDYMHFVGALAFSSDGRLLASGGRDAAVRLWLPASGKLLHSFLPQGEGSRHNNGVPCLAFSPDGRILATGSVNERRGRVGPNDPPPGHSVQLWDVATRKHLLSLRPAGKPPAFVTFSPDGRLLATSATWDEPIQLWSVGTGKEVRKLSGTEHRRHWGEFNPIAFSPDGHLLASGGQDNAVILWETASGELVRTLRGHHGPVRSVAFSPDGLRLISGSADQTALVWPVLSPKEALVRPDKRDVGTGERLWQALAQPAANAYPALTALTAAPEQAVQLLKARLKPDEELKDGEVARLITDLGAEKFATREAAQRRLRQLGGRAIPALRQALDAEGVLERRLRLRTLLDALDGSAADPELLRDLRGVQALARIGTPAAVAVLEALAGGGGSGSRTEAARAALARLAARRALTSPEPRKSSRVEQ